MGDGPSLSGTGEVVVVRCAVCRAHHRRHQRLATIERENPKWPWNDPRWGVRVWRKTSVVAAERKAGGDALFQILNSDAPWPKQKAVEDIEIKYGGAIELRCAHTSCKNSPGKKVKTLIEMAQVALAQGQNEIFVS